MMRLARMPETNLAISDALSARPIQAALVSAGSFAAGAAMPILVTATAPEATLIPLVSGTSLVFLAVLGGGGCACGRRGSNGRRNTSHFLGCAGHGGGRRSRLALRNGCVSGQPSRTPALGAHYPTPTGPLCVFSNLGKLLFVSGDRGPAVFDPAHAPDR